MSTARQYELVYIVTPEASEQEIADLHTQIEQIVQRYNGTFDKTENWGRKRMAYDIGRHREGLRVAQRTTDARKTFVARRRVARGLPPERQPGEGKGDGDNQDDMEMGDGR
jgi:ribosomal protein S6